MLLTRLSFGLTMGDLSHSALCTGLGSAPEHLSVNTCLARVRDRCRRLTGLLCTTAYLCPFGLLPISLTLDPHTYSSNFLMLKASSTDDAEDQRTQNDEQPAPEQDTVVVGPPEDSEEKDNGEPSAVLPSGISNAGPSQPPEPHVQERTSEVAPDGDFKQAHELS
ncbi:hypothetical protein EDB19DRAFT_1761491 [Suillus lakei]|nr:hypothetical protein EDB19DRAFT_1761491 [Suillus lakei]